MNYWIAYKTDVGTCKKINQDALLIKTAKTLQGQVMLGAIADGLGGLEHGELASNTMLHELSIWFESELPSLIYKDYNLLRIESGLIHVINQTHQKIRIYMEREKVNLGTTIALLFIYRDEYLVIHVGDTRVYMSDAGRTTLLTKDHTYVQSEVDAGQMTPGEAKYSKQRNILTQCVGASSIMIPTSQKGKVTGSSVFLICSDGFRNTILDEELENVIRTAEKCNHEEFKHIPEQMTELIKKRDEKDNISSIFMKCF